MSDQETLSINMTWKQSARIIAVALENGTTKGKQIAREELMRMADVADFATELQDELRKCQGKPE